MPNPTGEAVAAQSVAAVREGVTYRQMDCQAFVENMVRRAGGRMAYAGSNDMARNGVTWLGTLAEAKSGGRLAPGAGLFIHAADGGEPAKYRADGKGNYSHVGLYVGENALTDTDKNGNTRRCNATHSSQTMGRAAGSTLQNGWTHVGWFREIAYPGAPDIPAAQAPTKEAAPVSQASDTPAADATTMPQASHTPAADATTMPQASHTPAADATTMPQASHTPAADAATMSQASHTPAADATTMSQASDTPSADAATMSQAIREQGNPLSAASNTAAEQGGMGAAQSNASLQILSAQSAVNVQTGFVVAPSGSTVNLRRQRSVQSQLVTRLPIGTCVQLVALETDWACVSVAGMTGYMLRKYLALSAPDTAASQQPDSLSAALAALTARVAALEARQTAGGGR